MEMILIDESSSSDRKNLQTEQFEKYVKDKDNALLFKERLEHAASNDSPRPSCGEYKWLILGHPS